MDFEELETLCMNFRSSIEKVSSKNGFVHINIINDRMNLFPKGCCDDACDLLGLYIKKCLNIDSFQRSFVLIDYDGYRFNHNVLYIEDYNMIIDITGDQLGGPKVYVGPVQAYSFKTDEFYDYGNYDIENGYDKRLIEDYCLIMNELHKM